MNNSGAGHSFYLLQLLIYRSSKDIRIKEFLHIGANSYRRVLEQAGVPTEDFPPFPTGQETSGPFGDDDTPIGGMINQEARNAGKSWLCHLASAWTYAEMILRAYDRLNRFVRYGLIPMVPSEDRKSFFFRVIRGRPGMYRPREYHKNDTPGYGN